MAVTGEPEKPVEVQYTNDILAMISPEAEKVSLGKVSPQKDLDMVYGGGKVKVYRGWEATVYRGGRPGCRGVGGHGLQGWRPQCTVVGVHGVQGKRLRCTGVGGCGVQGWRPGCTGLEAVVYRVGGQGVQGWRL